MTKQAEDQHDPVLDEQLTQLVSYLDGELDATQMTEVEHHLVSDSAMRSHADILSKTWSLLDELDDVSVSESFTQQTMATIATQTVDDQKLKKSNDFFKSFATTMVRYKVLPAFVVGLLSGCIGLFVSERVQERQKKRNAETAVDQLIIDNIDILPNAGLYELVPDADTLKELQLVTNDEQETSP